MHGSGSAVVVHHQKRFVGGRKIMLFYANTLVYKEAYSQTNNRLEGNLFNAAS